MSAHQPAPLEWLSQAERELETAQVRLSQERKRDPLNLILDRALGNVETALDSVQAARKELGGEPLRCGSFALREDACPSYAPASPEARTHAINGPLKKCVAGDCIWPRLPGHALCRGHLTILRGGAD